MKSTDKIDAREIRRKMGMNQQQFWSKLGVTQSGGSRYESGRNMPARCSSSCAWFMSRISILPR